MALNLNKNKKSSKRKRENKNKNSLCNKLKLMFKFLKFGRLQ